MRTTFISQEQTATATGRGVADAVAAVDRRARGPPAAVTDRPRPAGQPGP